MKRRLRIVGIDWGGDVLDVTPTLVHVCVTDRANTYLFVPLDRVGTGSQPYAVHATLDDAMSFGWDHPPLDIGYGLPPL